MPNDNPAPVNQEDDPLIGLPRPYGHMSIRASRLAHLKKSEPATYAELTSGQENANGSQ